MSNRIVSVGCIIGLSSWIVAICGSLYFNYANKNEVSDQLAIFKSGVFETVHLILLCAFTAFIGFVISFLSKHKTRKRVLSLVINGLLFFPVFLLLFTQYIGW